MPSYPDPIQKLIDSFARLPTIGPKTAERLVFYLLKKSKAEIEELVSNLGQVKDKILRCSVCNNFSEKDPCSICSDSKRNGHLLCVVADHQDQAVIEKTKNFDGLYFVLNGMLEPLQGLGPEDIRVPELIKRIKNSPTPIKEVILAFNPDINGETTVLYITKILKPLGVKVTRLARGLPVGADLEYADEITLTEAINNRREI